MLQAPLDRREIVHSKSRLCIRPFDRELNASNVLRASASRERGSLFHVLTVETLALKIHDPSSSAVEWEFGWENPSLG